MKKTRRWWVLLASVFVGSTGCGSSGLDTSAGLGDESADSPGMAMTLLARIERSPTNIVSFYDSEIGIVITETGRAEEAGQHASLGALRKDGMTAAFRSLAKDESVEVPRALLAAENIWRERQAARVKNPASAVAPPPGAVEPIQTKIPTRNEGESSIGYTGGSSVSVALPEEISNSVVRSSIGEAVGVNQSALGGLPTDAAWWGNLPECQYSEVDATGTPISWYDGVWCATDATRAWTGWRDTMYYEVTAFGQGNYATVHINKWINGAWVLVTNETVAYREYFTFSTPPENGAYYYSEVSGNAAQTIGISERYRLAMPNLTSLYNDPNAAEYDFGNDIQGITHDTNNWYLTRTKWGTSGPKYGILAKVPLSTSLNNPISNAHGMPSSWNEVFNHYGDLVHMGGRLYVAMTGENTDSAVGIFDSALNPISYVMLSHNGLNQASAVAFNPKDSLFYVPSDDWHIQKYYISTQEATWMGTLTLSQPIGVQGAKFSTKGNLWLLGNGTYYGVDGANGAVMVVGSINMGSADEGEGLDIFDLDVETRPGLSGQIHFQFLENDFWEDDQWWLMHLQAPIDRL